jgi:hypothetical protein
MLNKYEENFLNVKPKKESYSFEFDNASKIAINISGLPSKRLYELDGIGGGILDLSLLWSSYAQRSGFVAWVDSEENCYPELLEKYNINLEKFFYIQSDLNEVIYPILTTLLKTKELRLIIINSIDVILPLTYEIKEFTTNFSNLQQSVKESEASIIIINPYYNLSYDILNRNIAGKFYVRKIKKDENCSFLSVSLTNNLFNLKNVSYEIPLT